MNDYGAILRNACLNGVYHDPQQDLILRQLAQSQSIGLGLSGGGGHPLPPPDNPVLLLLCDVE